MGELSHSPRYALRASHRRVAQGSGREQHRFLHPHPWLLVAWFLFSLQTQLPPHLPWPAHHSFRGHEAVRKYEESRKVDVEEQLGVWLAQGAKALGREEVPAEGSEDGQAAADFQASDTVERSQWPVKVLAVFEKLMAG